MNYETAIKESVNEISQLEKKTKNLKGRDRVRFIRLLKSGEATSQKQAGKMIGLAIRQSQRLWEQYRKEGLRGLSENRYQGRKSKLSELGRRSLGERLKKDDVKSLQQAQAYLAAEEGVNYTIGGVSYLFKQLKIKLKTGRPSNYEQSVEAVDEFKKRHPT